MTVGDAPTAWVVGAHFHGDPVWPGSLGLEAFLQLLQLAAARRWGVSPTARWQIAPGVEHSWVYRGQVIPTDGAVTVEAVVTAVDDAARSLRAAGFLAVDGRVIYQMTDFSLSAHGLE